MDGGGKVKRNLFYPYSTSCFTIRPYVPYAYIPQKKIETPVTVPRIIYPQLSKALQWYCGPTESFIKVSHSHITQQEMETKESDTTTISLWSQLRQIINTQLALRKVWTKRFTVNDPTCFNIISYQLDYRLPVLTHERRPTNQQEEGGVM